MFTYCVVSDKHYLPPGVDEIVAGRGSAIGILFPSPGVLIVLPSGIVADPQSIEILQSYLKNAYDKCTNDLTLTYCITIYNSKDLPGLHLHMTKLMHRLDIVLYSQLNSRLAFPHLHLLTISVINMNSLPF